MEDGPPMFSQSFSCSDLLVANLVLAKCFRVQGYHLLSPDFPDRSTNSHCSANPRSLAATRGISVDFFSSGYLDVSVLRVRFHTPMYSVWDTQLMLGGFPHSDIFG